MEIITNRYKKETGLSAYKYNWFGKRIHNQKYIDWLEKQCTKKDQSRLLSEIIKGYEDIGVYRKAESK